MTAYCNDRPENAEEGYKCSACGYMWGSKEAKDKCPMCGFVCNPYSCEVIDASNEDY